MEKTSETVLEALDKMGIAYRHLVHKPASTMEDCLPIEREMGAYVCKNVFLRNRQGTKYFLLIMRADKRFRAAEVSKKLECARLSFGSEEKLAEFLHLYGGAVSPMGLLFDSERNVQLVIDSDLLREEALCFHPCVNTETVRLSVDDFLHRFLPGVGHVPVVIDI